MDIRSFHGLPGVDIRPDTGAGVLRINMPQAWLEYSDARSNPAMLRLSIKYE
ncbi:hypothetical protein MYL26_19390 [Escherichia coli]|uniref:hypothetical protein n=1 Tax=Escherichia coli TaxID=562 RepID=UPI00388F431A